MRLIYQFHVYLRYITLCIRIALQITTNWQLRLQFFFFFFIHLEMQRNLFLYGVAVAIGLSGVNEECGNGVMDVQMRDTWCERCEWREESLSAECLRLCSQRRMHISYSRYFGWT